jgi:hypothetical protein
VENISTTTESSTKEIDNLKPNASHTERKTDSKVKVETVM